MSHTLASLPADQAGIVLAALRHLQGALITGADLSDIAEIIEMDAIDPELIDDLCEAINFGDDEMPADHAGITLAALRHLQDALIAGTDPSGLAEIIDLEAIEQGMIDRLCMAINLDGADLDLASPSP